MTVASTPPPPPPLAATANLEVALSSAPNPAVPGDPLTYRATTTNRGPATANNARVTVSLPSTVEFRSASGGCSPSGAAVTCSLGNLANGQSASRDVVVIPRREGSLSAIAQASSDSGDPSPAATSATTAAALPAPQTRRTFNSSVKAGDVTVKCPGDRRFREIVGDNDLSFRCLVDTRKGRLEVTTTAGAPFFVQIAVFSEGIFKAGQTRGPRPVTELRLAGRLYTGRFASGSKKNIAQQGAPPPATAVGPRPRPLPHPRTQGLGLGARHHLAGGGPLEQHHLLQGHPGPRDGARLRPPPHHEHRRPGPQEDLHREAAPPPLSRSGQGRIRTASFLAVGLAAVALALTAYFTDMLESPELSTVDTRFDIRGDQDKPRDLAVVAVDDVTFDELGEQWPFPRSLHAKAVDRLKKDGAKVIAYDVQFTEAPTPTRTTRSLTRWTPRARWCSALPRSTRRAHEHPGWRRRAARAGRHPGQHRGGPRSPAQVRRQDSRLDTLPLASVKAAGGKVDRSGFDGDGEAWIDYRGGPGSIQTVSFSRVVNGKFKPGTFRGRTVVVGAAAPSLQDVHTTSTTGQGELMSGPEVQAHAIWTAANGLPLKPGGGVLSVLLIALAGMVAPAASLRLVRGRRCWRRSASRWSTCCSFTWPSVAGVILPVLYPLLALVLSAIGALGIHLLLTAFERQRTRDVFARFVPERSSLRRSSAPTTTCASAACVARARSCSATCAVSPASPRSWSRTG